MDQGGKSDAIDLLASAKTSDVIGFNLPKSNVDHQEEFKYYGVVSEEEMKIRGELEVEIERDLEQEIKDGIYHLALRLHRLYRQRKDRENVASGAAAKARQGKSKLLSELTVCVRLQGGTKIEVTETKKEAPQVGRPRAGGGSHVWQGLVVARSTKKKFDWAGSLRSGDDSWCPTPTNRKPTERSRQLQWKSLKDENVAYFPGNSDLECVKGEINSGKPKENARVDNNNNNNKALELGWKW